MKAVFLMISSKPRNLRWKILYKHAIFIVNSILMRLWRARNPEWNPEWGFNCKGQNNHFSQTYLTAIATKAVNCRKVANTVKGIWTTSWCIASQFKGSTMEYKIDRVKPRPEMKKNQY